MEQQKNGYVAWTVRHRLDRAEGNENISTFLAATVYIAFQGAQFSWIGDL